MDASFWQSQLGILVLLCISVLNIRCIWNGHLLVIFPSIHAQKFVNCLMLTSIVSIGLTIVISMQTGEET